ncbi:ATP-binding cassette domain-containing protein [Tomitella biformata]|uniref:ATP-binding cassette domain-containing protein n=1 Tax=Tomitella biformata TaxID=630403 RepID=UPI000465FBD7|nr:ATP-binding cassette domain-containing protein [Tomitella biformata]
MSDMISARGLIKRYKSVTALGGIDLSVPEGTVLGLLGPNGAGKTTAVRIISTLLIPDEGTVEIAGVDVLAEPDKARSRLGLSGQNAAVDEYLTGFENLDMVGRLYGFNRARSRARATELLEMFSLSDAGNRPSKTYSGGMRRRLDLAAALVAAPPVLILDEPTTGLDPRSRNEMWAVIRDLVRDGSTVLLTTQYLEEADRLADDIVVIDQGTSIAHGTADQLKDQFGADRIELVVADPAHLGAARRVLETVSGGTAQVDEDSRELSVPAVEGAASLMDALRQLDAEKIAVSDIGLRRPTLDDVFLTLTGHATEKAEDADNANGPAGTTEAKAPR